MKKNIINVIRFLFSFLKKKETSQKQFVYVAIGDSTIEGIGASSNEKSFAFLLFAFLKKHIDTVLFYNFGKIHSRIQDVVDLQLPQAIAKNPDLVVISVGANDIRRRTSAKTFDAYYAKLLKILKAQTHATIVINTIPDLSLLSIIPLPVRIFCKWWVHRFNQKIIKHTKQARVILVDTYTKSSIIRTYKELVAEDGIHPSDRGHALWAEHIIKHTYHILFPQTVTVL